MNVKAFLLLVVLLAFAPGWVWAEETEPNVRIEVQIVTLPQETALPLINDLKDDKKIEAAYTRIQELLGASQARLIGWPMASTRSGQRVVIESVDELRYGTEFTPPTVSYNPSWDPGKKIPPPKVDVTVFNATPTAFETRNVGVTLEVEPVIDADGQTISLNLVLHHVLLKGYTKTEVLAKGTRQSVVVEQPEFENKQVTTALTLKTGRRSLLGVYPLPEPPNTVELFLLKAELEPIK